MKYRYVYMACMDESSKQNLISKFERIGLGAVDSVTPATDLIIMGSEHPDSDKANLADAALYKIPVVPLKKFLGVLQESAVNTMLEFASELKEKQRPIHAPSGNVKICITGFAIPEKRELQHIARTKGYWPVAGVSKSLDYLVVGANPGPSKMAKAKEYGIKLISKEDFLALISISETMASQQKIEESRTNKPLQEIIPQEEIDKATEEFRVIVAAIVCDSELTEGEFEYLCQWLTKHDHLTETDALRPVFDLAAEILEDGIITQDELTRLGKFLQREDTTIASTQSQPAPPSEMEGGVSRMHADERECPFCAEIIKARAKVCRYCSRELITAESAFAGEKPSTPHEKIPSSDPIPQKKKTTKKETALGCGCMVIIAFAALWIIGVLFGGKKEPEHVMTPAPASPTATQSAAESNQNIE